MLRTLLLVVLLGPSVAGQTPVPEWVEDLDFLVRELPRLHVSPFTRISKEEWQAKARSLIQRLPELDDVEREAELAALVAALGDSHTQVSTPRLFAATGPFLPVNFYWFADGLRLQAAPKKDARFLGWTLTAVGGQGVEEAVARVRRFHVMENEAAVRLGFPGVLAYPRFLRIAGLAKEGVPHFTLRSPEGETVDWDPTPVPRFDRSALALARPRQLPMTAEDRSRWHWYRFLPDEGLLYVQYNRCAISAEFDTGRLADELHALCSGGKVAAIVFDLRFNGGGDSRLGDALFARLAEVPPLKEKKNVFVLIGRRTFSSAILNALALKRGYGAVLLGESTAGSPNHFGEVKRLKLENTGLLVSYSTKVFRNAPEGTRTLDPDHEVPLRYEDQVEGRPVHLDKVRSLIR